MTVDSFLATIAKKIDEKVVIECVGHILNKAFNSDAKHEESFFVAFLCDYQNCSKYLNDFMGVICRQYNTSVDNIYEYLCEVFEQEADNKTLFDFRINRLLINTPQRVLSIINEDIKIHNLEHMIQELAIILESKYYNKTMLENRKTIEKIQSNIISIQEALKYH